MPELMRCVGQMGEYWMPVTDDDRKALDGLTRVKVTTERNRTRKQNNALHKWLGELADALNDAGLDMRRVIKQEVDIPWTLHSAKEFLWRPIQQAMTGHTSTTQPSTKDYIVIQDTLIAHLSRKFGVSVEWPSIDRMDREQQERELCRQ